MLVRCPECHTIHETQREAVFCRSCGIDFYVDYPSRTHTTDERKCPTFLVRSTNEKTCEATKQVQGASKTHEPTNPKHPKE